MNIKKIHKQVVKESRYVLYKKLETDVNYKIRNGQVIINIKDIIDGVLDKESIGKYKTNNVYLNIPFDMNHQVTGNAINLIIDKKRFTLRMKAMEIIPSKQQKIDFDNTHSHRWSGAQWAKFIEQQFFNAYGFKNLELDFRNEGGNLKRAKVFGQINSMRKKILGIKDSYTDSDVVNYIRWAFTVKVKNSNCLSLGLLKADGMIQEWMAWRSKNGSAKKKVRKWDG